MRLANGLNEFYSRNFNDDDLEYFVDKNGYPAIDYPHVHVVFRKGIVYVIASHQRDSHVWRTKLQSPDGNEVNSAIKTAISYL